MTNIFAHIGLAPHAHKEITSTATKKNKNRNYQRQPGGIDAVTRTLLGEFFRPYNDRLSDMLGDERFKILYNGDNNTSPPPPPPPPPR